MRLDGHDGFRGQKSHTTGAACRIWSHADVIGLLTAVACKQAKASDPSDYNAMTLSTVGRMTATPTPASCCCAHLEQTEGGWSVAFYTNYQQRQRPGVVGPSPCRGHVFLECP